MKHHLWQFCIKLQLLGCNSVYWFTVISPPDHVTSNEITTKKSTRNQLVHRSVCFDQEPTVYLLISVSIILEVLVGDE